MDSDVCEHLTGPDYCKHKKSSPL